MAVADFSNNCTIDNYEPRNGPNMKHRTTYISINFATSNPCHCTPTQYSCSCNDNEYGHFTPIDCSLIRPTQITQVQPTLPTNTKVQATTIPFTTTTKSSMATITTTNTSNSSIATIVAPAVTATILLCISVATGSALLCALCIKKRKQDLTTLHSDSKDQRKYNE